MKYLEHHDEVAALCAIAVMLVTVDWVVGELASLIAPLFGA